MNPNSISGRDEENNKDKKEGDTIAESRTRIYAPSLDATKDSLSAEVGLRDVRMKLGALAEKHHLAEATKTSPVTNIKAFTYHFHTASGTDNLFTWIKTSFWEERKNKQNEGANYLLRASHLYNAEQLQRGGPLCFVQNVSVNRWGDALGYHRNNPLLTETTLMSEMAILHNLGCSRKQDRELYQSIFNSYEEYLRTPAENRHPYFSASLQGKKAIENIAVLKNSWAISTNQPNKTDLSLVEIAKRALRIMVAHDLHHKHHYAQIVSVLSVYIEEASISDERADRVHGQVAILDSIENKSATDRDNDLVYESLKALSNYHALEGSVKTLADDFKNALDSEYDKQLQSGVLADEKKASKEGVDEPSSPTPGM